MHINIHMYNIKLQTNTYGIILITNIYIYIVMDVYNHDMYTMQWVLDQAKKSS